MQKPFLGYCELWARLWMILAVCCLLPARTTKGQAPKLLEVQLSGQQIYGMPVHWGTVDAAVIAPDGRFHFFDLASVQSHRVLNQDFQPLKLTEARSHLSAELGSNFDTMVFGPYVIATPRGEGARWQSRFTALLSGFTRYCGVRGWSLRQPDFPLVVIVFPNRQEFLAYAQAHNVPLPGNAAGCYYPRSNRCILYQLPGHQGIDWSETEATIIHEAVHQLAYNTGVHERLFVNPSWFVEGLATMFERRAVYELGVNRSEIRDRMHWQQISAIRPLLADPAALERATQHIVESDTLFQSDARTGYGLAWALTFYLSERMPRQYQSFIRLQRERPFGNYTAGERLQDFRSAFGISFSMLGLQLNKFYDSVQ